MMYRTLACKKHFEDKSQYDDMKYYVLS